MCSCCRRGWVTLQRWNQTELDWRVLYGGVAPVSWTELRVMLFGQTIPVVWIVLGVFVFAPFGLRRMKHGPRALATSSNYFSSIFVFFLSQLHHRSVVHTVRLKMNILICLRWDEPRASNQYISGSLAFFLLFFSGSAVPLGVIEFCIIDEQKWTALNGQCEIWICTTHEKDNATVEHRIWLGLQKYSYFPSFRCLFFKNWMYTSFIYSETMPPLWCLKPATEWRHRLSDRLVCFCVKISPVVVFYSRSSTRNDSKICA